MNRETQSPPFLEIRACQSQRVRHGRLTPSSSGEPLEKLIVIVAAVRSGAFARAGGTASFGPTNLDYVLLWAKKEPAPEGAEGPSLPPSGGLTQ